MRACDAVLLPYRSASQSGVVQLAFSYGRPVVATRVGGLPDAVRDGLDGILCDPDPQDLAGAIRRVATEHERLASGVRMLPYRESAEHYGYLIEQALTSLAR